MEELTLLPMLAFIAVCFGDIYVGDAPKPFSLLRWTVDRVNSMQFAAPRTRAYSAG